MTISTLFLSRKTAKSRTDLADVSCEVCCQAIFLVGPSRSGKSLLAALLETIVPLHVYKELHFFELCKQRYGDLNNLSVSQAAEIYDRFDHIDRVGLLNQRKEIKRTRKADAFAEKWTKDGITAGDIYAAFLTEHTREIDPSMTPLDHTGTNIFYAEEIIASFDNPRIIYLTRDPRALLDARKRKWTLARKKNKSGRKLELWKQFFYGHPIMFSRAWSSYAKALKKHERSNFIMELKYEDLVRDPIYCVSELCAFLDTPFDEQAVRKRIKNITFKLDGVTAVGNIQEHKSTEWTTTPGIPRASLAVCQVILSKQLVQMGYKKMDLRANKFLIGLYFLSFPLYALAAAALNANRIQKIWVTLRR